MIKIHNLWHGTSWELPDDESVWRWAQEHLPSVMLRHPKDIKELMAAIQSYQNYAIEKPQEEKPIEIPAVTAVFQAAQLLVDNRYQDDPTWRAACVLYEDDPEAAALVTYGLEPTNENRESLRGLLSVVSMQKSEKVAPKAPHGEVRALNYEGAMTAEQISNGLEIGNAERFVPNGKAKHSGDSWIVIDPESQRPWLLKRGTGPQSPAAGAREEPASQSSREAAFFHAMKILRLSYWVPRADVIEVNKKPYAAMFWLGEGWQTAQEMMKADQGAVRNFLRKWLEEGLLHQLAAADWVLGNTDRHSGNVMIRQQEMRLIDHGGALAGDGFDPAHDRMSFSPWYLRVWVPGWRYMTPVERFRALPRLPTNVAEGIKTWASKIDVVALANELTRNGVSPGPTIRRFGDLLTAMQKYRADETINRAWTLGLDEG